MNFIITLVSVKATQTSVVSVILMTLGVPGVSVVWSQVNVWQGARVVDEVAVSQGVPGGPLVLAVLVTIAPDPVVSRIP